MAFLFSFDCDSPDQGSAKSRSRKLVCRGHRTLAKQSRISLASLRCAVPWIKERRRSFRSGCCRSACDMRPRDQPPQHWREIWRLIERMSAEDFRAFFIQGAEGLLHPRYGFPHLAYSFADEQLILGIDVACLYEGTRLLGTPAGVRLVHQSALVVHKVAQVSPRTGQALSKVVGSDLQHLSSNGVAYLEDRTEDKAQALFTIKAKKHSRGAGEHLLGH